MSRTPTWNDLFPTLTLLGPADKPSWADQPADPYQTRQADRRAATVAALIAQHHWQRPLGELMPGLAAALDEPVRALPFSTRAANALTRHGHHTVGDLLAVTITDLHDMWNVGEGTVADIVTVLAGHSVVVANQNPVGQPGPAEPVEPASFEDLLRQRANDMAAQFNRGVSLTELAEQHNASPEWVRRTIVDLSDWDIPVLRNRPWSRRHRDPAKEREKSEQRASTHQRNRERAAAMSAQLLAGHTLDQIGTEHGITRERVRQIINAYGDRNVPDLVAEREDVKKAAEAAVRDARQTAVTEWSQAHPGVPAAQAAADLGMDEQTIAGMLGGRRGLHSSSPTWIEKKWTDDQLLDWVRRFHADTGSTVSMEFETWAVPQGGPTRLTVQVRFSRWNLALQRAGVSDADAVKHRQRFSDNDLWAAVVEFLAEERERYSFGGYAQWQKSTPGVPSPALLRFRLDRRWVTIRDRALDAINHPELCDPDWVADVTTRRNWQRMGDGTFDRADAMQALIDAVAELGPDMSMNQYDAWASANNRPFLATVQRNTGLTWAQLRVAAGGTKPTARRAEWTTGDITDALDDFLATHPDGTSMEYHQWSAGVAERPSLSTVVCRFGSWLDAKRARQGAADPDTAA